MTKKEINFRPMFGFDSPKQSLAALLRESRDTPSKDEIIAELRAKLAVYEAREAKRRESAKAGMKKLRAKKK